MRLPRLFKNKGIRTTKDWAHQYLVHEIKFAFPDHTTTPGPYRPATREDFDQAVDQQALAALDVGPEQRPFEQGVRLRALELVMDLNEARLRHHKQCVRLRNEVEGYLGQNKVRLALLQDRLAQLDAEAESLRMEEERRKAT